MENSFKKGDLIQKIWSKNIYLVVALGKAIPFYIKDRNKSTTCLIDFNRSEKIGTGSVKIAKILYGDKQW